MKFLNKLIANLIFGIARLSGHLPFGLLLFKASLLRFFAEKVLRYRYAVIIQNLSRAFPGKNYNEIKTIAHQFYRHFFEVFAEVIKSQGMTAEEARRRCHVENPELITDLHQRGINIIALGGHWGNWEWLIMTPLFFNFSIYTLYKPLSSMVMEPIMGKIRKKFGIKLLPMQKAGKFILSKQDYPALYFFIGDQSPSHKDMEYCFPFMNQPSFFFTGGAKLAKATQSAVIYQSIKKIRPGYYTITYHTISEPDDKMTVKEMLQAYTRLLEGDIRKQPSHWLWSHKRWKNIPQD
ncbi:MAG: lysophospholipid acyltransferase family protein [Lentimicrobium sp.]|jgi:KDO2-lipid IV(A) lauroyltransferase|nr:lysophospholipid acyltransferase family protein [Lentimicrobium sp.]